MTTIAADLNMMVADRLVDDSGTKRKETKITRIRGDLIACAGDVSAGTAFKKWYKDKRRRKPNVDFDEFEALVLTPSGLFYYGHSLTPEEVSPFYSIGTGKPYVMAATMAGADLIQSVKIAIELDVYSGYTPQVERLHDPETVNHS